MSVVLPVRDGEDRIAARIGQVLDLMETMISEPDAAEIVVVDDGSRDDTAGVLDEIAAGNPRVRLVRHSRPRGMEAAGQTGLERATGDLVFIQEHDADIREEDMRRLYRMSQDPTIVAARAESKPASLSAELLRRLVAWGSAAERKLVDQPGSIKRTSLQMIRRPHLQRLAGPDSDPIRLHSETIRATSVETCNRPGD